MSEALINGFNLGMKYGMALAVFLLCLALAGSGIVLISIVTNTIQSKYRRRFRNQLVKEALDAAHTINQMKKPRGLQ